MNRKYIVRLEAKERCRLEQLVGVGKAAAYRIRHANILLAIALIGVGGLVDGGGNHGVGNIPFAQELGDGGGVEATGHENGNLG